jgi:hypothetical protein
MNAKMTLQNSLYLLPPTCFSFHTTSGANSASYPVYTRALSPGVKRQVREADHSPPSRAEVKNGGAIPLLLHTSSSCGA